MESGEAGNEGREMGSVEVHLDQSYCIYSAEVHLDQSYGTYNVEVYLGQSYCMYMFLCLTGSNKECR